MSTSNGWRQRYKVITRREFFTQPFKWFAREPSHPGKEETISCRVPLSALKNIPETELLRMVPVLRQGWRVYVCEDGIYYRDDSGQEGMMSLSPDECAATRLFNGVRTIEQVAATLAIELGMSHRQGVSIVREAFLTLALHEVYHPTDPPRLSSIPSPGEDQYA